MNPLKLNPSARSKMDTKNESPKRMFIRSTQSAIAFIEYHKDIVIIINSMSGRRLMETGASFECERKRKVAMKPSKLKHEKVFYTYVEFRFWQREYSGDTK